jgi:putative MATE family efflux protein
MQDLTTGKEGKQILKFAAPMLLGNLFQQTYNFVDSIIVGKFISKEALGAVGSSFPIIFALISFAVGIGTGGTIVISQYFGAKKYNEVVKAIDTIFIFMFIASVIIMTLGMTLSGPIFRLVHLPSEIMPDALTYIHTFLLGTFLFFGFHGISGILKGLGDSVTPLVFLAIASITNIGLDLLFINVFEWGIKGAAYATIAAQGGAFIAAIIYLNRTHKLIKIKIAKITFDRKIFYESLRIGLPSGLQQTFVSIGMIALSGIVNRFGSIVVSAYAAASRIDSLAILPSMMLGQALSTFTGQNLGAKKTTRVKKGLKATFMFASMISIVVTIIVLLLRYPLMKLFSSDTELIDIGVKYLVVVSLGYFFFSTMLSLNGVMRGAGDTLVPMIITFFSLWIIRIPIAHYLSENIGETGIWWSASISWCSGMIFSYLYYKTGNWKNKGIMK